MTHLEYMQSQADKNMAFHMENMECLQKECTVTLTFLFVVISASFSAAVKLFTDAHFILAISISVLCIYLSALAVYLVFSCLKARAVKAPANEPKKLAIKYPYTSEEIQTFELENLQLRIEFNMERNEKTAKHLNAVRVLICASPLVFLCAIVFLEMGACAVDAVLGLV